MVHRFNALFRFLQKMLFEPFRQNIELLEQRVSFVINEVEIVKHVVGTLFDLLFFMLSDPWDGSGFSSSGSGEFGVDSATGTDASSSPVGERNSPAGLILATIRSAITLVLSESCCWLVFLSYSIPFVYATRKKRYGSIQYSYDVF